MSLNYKSCSNICNKLMALLSIFIFPLSLTAAEKTFTEDLFSMSFEELMAQKVTSVSRTEEELFSAPAAIYVITQEDIRRSGVTSIPDALRMAPGLHVARIDGNKWAIAARGLNYRFQSKLLVQMDGRTLYSPLFSGVYWEYQDYVMEDIDRIEVIRGPGATLWGANAVNGIINIVTKTAGDTEGGLVSAGGGTEERVFGTVRYGGKFDKDTPYRVYARHFRRDETAVYGTPYSDDTDQSQVGFHIDWEKWDDQMFTLQGDYYDCRAGESIRFADLAAGTNPVAITDGELSGWNLLGRWNKDFSETADMQLQIYYDWNLQDYPVPDADYSQKVGIFDVDLQHRFKVGARHHLVWGLGYRKAHYEIHNCEKLYYASSNRSLHTYSGFFQDTIALFPDCINLILGIKLENNDFTGYEYQPSGRIVWTPNGTNTVWAALSRAVRVPSIGNNDATFVVNVRPPNTVVTINKNPDMLSEELLAHELGYRVQLTDSISMDVAAFYNRYEHLLSYAQINPNTLQYANEQDGKSHGAEIAINWVATDWWRLSTSYSWFKMSLHGGDETDEEDYPSHQFQVRSYLQVSDDLELNTALYYYDNVPTQDIPSFFRLDAGLTWHLTNVMDLSIWGQNLLDDKHPEFRADPFFLAGAGEIQRGVYGKITWRF